MNELSELSAIILHFTEEVSLVKEMMIEMRDRLSSLTERIDRLEKLDSENSLNSEHMKSRLYLDMERIECLEKFGSEILTNNKHINSRLYLHMERIDRLEQLDNENSSNSEHMRDRLSSLTERIDRLEHGSEILSNSEHMSATLSSIQSAKAHGGTATSLSDRNALARLSCGTKIGASTSRHHLSPLQAVPAQSGSAGYAHSQRRRNLSVIGYHRKRTRASHLIACTYNCRSICSAAQLSTLIDEAKQIKFDVIGLSETKREEPLRCMCSDGTGVFLGSRKADSTSGGVGFVVAPHFLNKVVSVTFHGHRFAVLTALLTNEKTVSIIQVYAPTADKDEEEHYDFYDQLTDLVHTQRSHYVVVSGDFNARIGARKPGEIYVGPHSAETRNEAGEWLASFCEVHHFFHGNSQFVKTTNKRWTHRSPDAKHHHELDHILCNRRAITDVSVVPSFDTGSDHRLLRARLHFQCAQTCIRRVLSRQPRRSEVDAEAVSRMMTKEHFEVLADLNKDYDSIVSTISGIVRDCRKLAPNHASRRFCEATLTLLEKRTQMDPVKYHLEYTALNCPCRKGVAKDHGRYARNRLLGAAEGNRSLKKARRGLVGYRLANPSLKAPDGTRSSSRPEMERIMANFFSELFKSNADSTVAPSAGEDVLPFLPSEVHYIVERMPQGKSPGSDGITAEMLRSCGEPLYRALAKRFTRYVRECQVPDALRKSVTILLFKKGDREDLSNYRPIALLPVLYKVFTCCVLARIRRTLDEAQPVEQAGFRRTYSRLDHIVTCCRLIEVAREHHMPLVLTFIDYKKAFDSVEPSKVWEALEEQGVERRYVNVLSKCYTNCTTVFRPFYKDVEVAVEKGLRQGDPISPNLFSACLESTIRRCDWCQFGIKIDGKRLNHLRFADKVVLITSSPEEANGMLCSLDAEGSKAGIVISKSKTKVMRNDYAEPTPVILNGNVVKDVSEYVYLGRLLNMKNDLKPELARRRKAAWAAFHSIKSVVEVTEDTELKAELFDSVVLPAMCYGCETWTLTKTNEDQLRTLQASLERRLVGLTLSQQRELGLNNVDVRSGSKVRDVVQHCDEAKHRFAGHLMRRNDGRWSTTTVLWYPRHHKRPPGVPPPRWSDSLAFRNNVRNPVSLRTVVHWTTIAKDSSMWERSWDPRKANRPCRKTGRLRNLRSK